MEETPIPETTEETKSSDIIDHLKKFKAILRKISTMKYQYIKKDLIL